MQQHQRRLYSFAIGMVAVLTIGTTLLPWVVLTPLGTPAGWNGLGSTSDASLALRDVGPHPYGWWVIAAAVLALAAALVLLRTAPSTSGSTIWLLWLAAVAALAALTVPITALVRPSWLIGDFITEIGGRNLADLMGRDFLSVPVLSFVIVGLSLLALLCAGTALTLRPLRLRIRISIDRGRQPAARPEPAVSEPTEPGPEPGEPEPEETEDPEESEDED